MIQNDGDLVRGLGFVTMHAAHLEGRVEDLLTILSPLSPCTARELKLPISKKIKKCIKTLEGISGPIPAKAVDDLKLCLDRFEWRNELVHSRIYSPYYQKENLKSARPNVPHRVVRSNELYDLANDLVELNARIDRSLRALLSVLCK